MKIILLTHLFPFCLTAMQLIPEQHQVEDKYLEARLSHMIPPDQVIYFLSTMPELWRDRKGFVNPIKKYLANGYMVEIHHDPDFVKIFRTCDAGSIKLHSANKLSSEFDEVQVTPTKFLQILGYLDLKQLLNQLRSNDVKDV